MALPAFLARLLSHFSSSNKANTTAEKNKNKQKQSVPASSNSSSTTTNTSTIKATHTPPPPVAKMPGVTAPSGSSKYDQIPGPLGLRSADLSGKVALVTGAGTYFSLLLFSSVFGCRLGCLGVAKQYDKGGGKGTPAPDGMAAFFTPTPSPISPCSAPATTTPFSFNPIRLSHLISIPCPTTTMRNIVAFCCPLHNRHHSHCRMWCGCKA